MEGQKARVLPKSAVGEAIEYAQDQWVALTRFLDDGRLSIDNNAVESEPRAVALGRKNWLAAGSEVGGERADIGTTMISSAVASGVEPVEWLTDVLERIVTCPPNRLIELLPDRWKAARRARSPVSPDPTADEHSGTTDAPTNTPASSHLCTPTDTATDEAAVQSLAVTGEDRCHGGPIRPLDSPSDRLWHVETTSTACLAGTV